MKITCGLWHRETRCKNCGYMTNWDKMYDPHFSVYSPCPQCGEFKGETVTCRKKYVRKGVLGKLFPMFFYKWYWEVKGESDGKLPNTK